MNKKAIGEISTAKILARLLEKGKQVAIPFGDNLRYDLVIIEGNQAIRIQCKTARGNSESFLFRTCSQNPFTAKRRCYKDSVDMFAVYYPRNGKVYLLPIADVLTEDSCTLRLTSAKNKQTKGTRLATMYEF